MKQNFILLSLIAILISLNAQADKRNVLFIGNSYTGVNNLPNIVQGITTSMGDTLTFDSYVPGGKTASAHWNDATTKAKITQGGWDYVVIQCQSQEPSFSPGQVMSGTYPYLKSLDSLVKATNSCAEVLYYMTWGRKNGDAVNCPNYPPICTYDGMQQRLRESYLLFANDFNSSVSPVGVAWKKLRDTNPSINLYTADESHPSINGSFLAACVFYSSLFKKSCTTNQYLPAGVTNSNMGIIQTIASNTVLDSLENWQGDGNIPDVGFIYQVNGNSVSFINDSKRFAISSWDFGDGSPLDNSPSPMHTFPAAGGSFNICLTISSACGKNETLCQSIMVSPNSTLRFSATDKIKIGQNGHQIIITNELENCKLNLLDINGRKIKDNLLNTGSSIISMNDIAKGIYILQISQKGNLLKLQKVWNK